MKTMCWTERVRTLVKRATVVFLAGVSPCVSPSSVAGESEVGVAEELRQFNDAWPAKLAHDDSRFGIIRVLALLAREGEQTGVAYPRVKRTLCSARRSRLGVRMCFALMKPYSLKAWSSEMMRMMLGFSAAAAVPAAAVSNAATRSWRAEKLMVGFRLGRVDGGDSVPHWSSGARQGSG